MLAGPKRLPLGAGAGGLASPVPPALGVGFKVEAGALASAGFGGAAKKGVGVVVAVVVAG